MLYLVRFTFVFLSFSVLCNAQKKPFTLEDIWGGKFRTKTLASLNPMLDGSHYSVLNRTSSGSTIDVYEYATSEKTKTLLDTRDLSEIRTIIDYSFSADEKKVLLTTTAQQIYRRSSKGRYYVYDLSTKKLNKVSDELIQEPTLSPDGNRIAYAYNNNLYIKDLTNDTVIQITSDGEANKIINGITDWVYEEEFAFVKAFDWNSTGTHLAYLQFDEQEVPEFSMDLYGKDLYPTQQVFKYPKAGEKNSTVKLFIYELVAKKAVKVPLDNYKDFYIARIQWTKDPNIVSAQVLNRHQNQLDLVFISTEDSKPKVVVTQTDPAYIDVTDTLIFLEDNTFLWTNEEDGYNHLYHYDQSGKLMNQITKGNWEVTDFYGYDAKTKTVFYQSVENGSINKDVYSIKLNGKNKKRLSQRKGTHYADFSADYSVYIDTFSSIDSPPVFSLHEAKTGKMVRTIKDNTSLKNTIEEYALQPKEFSTLQVNGEELNMWMIKPVDFDASKKYPLFMFQYSGPGSQQVQNTWYSNNDYWYQLLASKGYIIACVDGRGTGMKGARFKKVTQKNLGKLEVEDQTVAAQQLGAREYIDADRIGIWGWSYGGFMSSNCLFQSPDTFEMAIAVAPVTNWRNYDSIYTERYMTTPQENASGYDQNSPINHVDGLKGDFLLVHGSGDDNVHVQNTMQMVEALIQANKPFDWAIYPDKNHGIYGGNTRLHLYTKMTNFIQEHL